MKLIICFLMAFISFSSFGKTSLISETQVVRVSSGGVGIRVSVDGVLVIPMTELAAATVLKLQGKGKFNCEVKVVMFENGGRASSDGANMLYSINNCSKVND